MSAQSDAFHDYRGGIFQEQNHHENQNHSRSTSLIIGLTRAARGVEGQIMRWCLSGGGGIGGLLTDGWIIWVDSSRLLLVLVGWGRYWCWYCLSGIGTCRVGDGLLTDGWIFLVGY